MFIDKNRAKALRFSPPTRKNHFLPNKEQIDELEKKIGAPLPSNYRNFLSQHGGWIIDAEFDIHQRHSNVATQQIERF